MAGDEKLVLNHVLCFLFSRLHRSEVRPLKVILLNFYSSDDISLAKDVLVNCVKTLQSVDNTARIPRRRESENRTARELDDIFSLIADLDATKLLSDLPKFVSDSPDKMPSVNLVEGDLNAVMQRFDKLDIQLYRLETSVNKSVVSAAAAITQHVTHVSSGRGAINNPITVNEHTEATSLTNVNNNVNNQGASASASTSHWAASYVSSIESGSCAEVSDAEEGQWHEAKRRKRRRTPSDPQNNANSIPNRSNPVNTYATAASKPPTKQQPQPQHKHKHIPTVYGRSRKPISSDITGVDQITAAKPYVGKATFCVDNVSLTATAESMASYVAAMDIDVLGCYEVNPRRTIWQRQQGIYPNDRKTFRICIPKEDSKHFLDPMMWPAHIAVSQWRFKKRQDEANEKEVTGPAPHAASRPAPLNGAPLGSTPSNSAPLSLGPRGIRPGTPLQQHVTASASAAGSATSATSGEVLQSTSNRFTALSSDSEPIDMDATILVLNHGDAVK